MLRDRTLHRFLLAVLAVVTIALLWVRFDLLQQYRTDIAGAEFNVVYGVQKLMLGQPLYEDPELPPFDIVQYTPLYHWTCAAIGGLLRVDPLEPHSVFLVSRWLSLCFNALTVLLVFLTVVRHASRVLAAWAALLCFMAFSQHFFSRSDSLYALFFIAAVHCFLRWSTAADRRASWLLLAVLFAVLSFMAKQTGAFILVLIPLHLCLIGAWRDLLRYMLAAALLLGAGLAIIAAIVPFDVFVKNTVQGLMNGTSARFLRMMVQPHLYVYYIGWHIASLALIPQFFRRRHPDLRFFATALPASLAFSFATAMKSGSDFNYFFENMVLAFMALAIGLGPGTAPTGASDGRKPTRWLLLAVMVYSIAFAVHRTRMFRGWSLHHSEPEVLKAGYDADLEVRDVLHSELGLRPDDGVFITYRGHLEHLLVGQSMLTQKDIIEWSMTPPFDYARFDAALRDGTIRYVVSDEPLDTLRIMDRAYGGFTEVRLVGTRHILARTRE